MVVLIFKINYEKVKSDLNLKKKMCIFKEIAALKTRISEVSKSVSRKTAHNIAQHASC